MALMHTSCLPPAPSTPLLQGMEMCGAPEPRRSHSVSLPLVEVPKGSKVTLVETQRKERSGLLNLWGNQAELIFLPVLLHVG